MSGTLLPEITEHLLLARLLVPAAKPLSRGELKKSLSPLFERRLTSAEWTEQFDAALDRLIGNGMVAGKPVVLTEAGRERAIAYWQIDKLPAQLKWATLLKTVVVPRVLGIAPQKLQTKKPADALAAAVVRQAHSLSSAAKSPAEVVNALACKQIGMVPECKFTSALFLSKQLLDSERPLKADEVARRLARQTLNAAGGDLFTAAVQHWIGEGRHGESQPVAGIQVGDEPVTKPADLSRFARSGGLGLFLATWRS